MSSIANKAIQNNRSAKWDNARAILIFLVVLGHFADKYAKDNPKVGALFVAIYLFHMPAFMFISGLFSKKLINAEKFRWDKVIPYLYMSFILNYYRVLTQRPWNPNVGYHPLRFNNVSWYFFVIFVYVILTKIIKKVPWYAIMITAIIIACLVGYVDKAPQIFFRLGLLYPYFYLGYMLDPITISEILNNKRLKLLAALIVTTWAAICLVYTKEIYVYRRLITNANSYQMAGMANEGCLWMYRLTDIVLVIIVMFSVFCLAPSKRMEPLSTIGSRTLGIYFWHLGLVEVIVHSEWFNRLIEIDNKMLLIIFLIASASITVILSIRIFSIPLEAAMRAPQILNSRLKKERE